METSDVSKTQKWLRPGIITGVLIFILWICFAKVLVPHIVDNAYRGQSLTFLNHRITGQAHHPVSDYLEDWNRLAWELSIGLLLIGAAALALRFAQSRSILLKISPMVLAYALVHVMIAVSFIKGAAPYRVNWIDGWQRWDSGQYITIATHGYLFYSCAGLGVFGPHDWCGDTGWFPGYPYVIRLALANARPGFEVSPIVSPKPFPYQYFVPDIIAGVIISAIFGILTLALIWFKFPAHRSWITLAMAACFPGCVYYHVVFPISMVTFFSVLCLYLLTKEKWLAAGFAAAGAIFSYHLPVLLVFVCALYVLWVSRKESLFEILKRLVATSGIAALGFAAVLLIQKIQTGYWTALFMLDKRDHHHLQWPWLTLFQETQLLFSHDWRIVVPALQLLFVSLMVWVFLAFALARGRESNVDAALIIFVIVFWIGTTMWDVGAAHPRTAGLLLPASLLQSYVPRWVSYLLLAGMIVFIPLMAILFYRWKLEAA